jgi:hypothetical protein
LFNGWKENSRMQKYRFTRTKPRLQDLEQLVLFESCWCKFLNLRAALEISRSCLSEGVIESIQSRGSDLAIFLAPA